MLVHNWRAVLKHAWSVHLMALALLCIVLKPAYTFVAAAWVSRNIYIQRRNGGDVVSSQEIGDLTACGIYKSAREKPCEYFGFHLTG